MKVYYEIFGLKIPSYGTMIVLGALIANVICFLMVIKKDKKDPLDLIILEAYGLLGGFIGSKLLYIIVSFDDIEWNRITELEYFSRLISGGYVFYGGLIGALFFVILFGKIHKLDWWFFLRKYTFGIPLAHAFGRLGCFMAGCCYGIPYEGVFSVVFPSESFAPSGIGLFPVQLIESACLLILALILLIYSLKGGYKYSIPIYLISYGVIRFILEYLRYDAYRGEYFGLYTSQWISIFMVLIGVVIIIYTNYNKKIHGK